MSHGEAHDRLLQVIDVQTLQHVQDTLASLAGVIVVVSDDRAALLTTPSSPNVYTRLLLSSDTGRSKLEQAILSAVERARSSGDVLTLHAGGPVRYSAPIAVGNRPIGWLHMGDRPRGLDDLQEIARVSSEYGIPVEKLQRALARLPAHSDELHAQTVELLRLLAQTLARLCSQEEQLRERLDELNTVYDISGLLAGKLPLDEALGQVCSKITEVLSVAACSIRLLVADTNELRLAASAGMSQLHMQGTGLQTSLSEIDKEALRGRMVYVQDIQTDPRAKFPQITAADGLHSALCAPLMHRDQAIGTMRIYAREVKVFSGFDTALLRACASQVASAVANYRMLEDRLAKADSDRQMRLAGQVQRRMIPSAPPTIPGFDIAARYETSLQMGGDFYDFCDVPNNNVGVVIADVAGKGAPAALLMVAVRSAIRIYAQNIFEIRQIMQEINRSLERDTLSSEFATVWYGVINKDRRLLTYVNAGHDAPMLLRDGAVRNLETGGLVVGIDPEASYQQEAIELRAKDVLLMFTDGATEAMDYNDEKFGRERIRDTLMRYAHLPAEQILLNLRMEIWRFTGLRSQADDMTMVCIKVL